MLSEGGIAAVVCTRTLGRVGASPLARRLLTVSRGAWMSTNSGVSLATPGRPLSALSVFPGGFGINTRRRAKQVIRLSP